MCLYLTVNRVEFEKAIILENQIIRTQIIPENQGIICIKVFLSL